MTDFISVGKLIKPHRLNGEIAIRVNEVYEDDILSTEKIFIEHHGCKIPYFLESIKNGNPMIIKLEDVSSPEDTHDICNKTIFLDVVDVSEAFSDYSDFEFGHLIDYTIIDTTSGIQAKITEILSFPQQELAVVILDEKEVMIPLNNSLIDQIDQNNTSVFMTLPEGIFSM